MLTITHGEKNQTCDGMSRRGFLKIGALGIGSLTMADLLRAEARAGVSGSQKAVINVQLGGGPSHQDMWDLKPDAPVEYRGEFNPIRTNVPGIEICEHFPRLAKMADKFALVRALVGNVNEHSISTSQIGFGQREMRNIGGPPAAGAVVAKLLGAHENAPPFVSLMGNISPGYLGPTFKPFETNQARDVMRLQRITADRLRERTSLLGGLDRIRRDLDGSGQMDAMDAFTRRAVDVVLSGRVADALELDKEDPKVRARYTDPSNSNYRSQAERFLLARRLVEAGVRCVSLSFGGWDTHSNNFTTLRKQLPAMDAAIASLIADLHERGMGDDVTIVVWGEFGRTPRVNGNGGGRDHWPQVAAAFIAGGGIKNGQVVGRSDRIAGQAAERPVQVQEVHATLYRNLGINPETTQIIDPNGRPQYLLKHRKPIKELA